MAEKPALDWSLLKKHTEGLGQLCITWAVVDRLLDSIIMRLLNSTEDKTAAITTSVVDVAPRCEIIKRLLMIEAPSVEWRECCNSLLQRVSGEVAPLRNRYVHDHWALEPEGLVRTDKRGKIGRAQSHQPETFMFNTEHVTDPLVLERFNAKVQMVMTGLAFAELDLVHWRKTGLPIKPAPILIEASMPNSRYLTLREHHEAPRRKTSPSGLVFD